MKSSINNDGVYYDTLSYRKLYKLARRFYKKNKFFEAVSILKVLIDKGERLADIMLIAARCYERIGYLNGDNEYEDLSLVAYRDILQMNLKKRKRKKILKEYQSFISRIQRFGERENGAVEKAKILEREATTPKAWFILGSNFDIRKDVKFVINAFQSALELDPHYIPALLRLGYIYQYILEDEPKARHYYLRLVSLNPDSAAFESEMNNARNILDGCTNLAKIYLNQKQYKKVMYLLTRALEIRKFLPKLFVGSVLKELTNLAFQSADEINAKVEFNDYLKSRFNISLDPSYESNEFNMQSEGSKSVY